MSDGSNTDDDTSKGLSLSRVECVVVDDDDEGDGNQGNGDE